VRCPGPVGTPARGTGVARECGRWWKRTWELAGEAIRRQGGDVRPVIFPDTGHGDAIERASAPGSELYDWLATMLAADR
jgi:hypothetical protein